MLGSFMVSSMTLGAVTQGAVTLGAVTEVPIGESGQPPPLIVRFGEEARMEPFC